MRLLNADLSDREFLSVLAHDLLRGLYSAQAALALLRDHDDDPDELIEMGLNSVNNTLEALKATQDYIAIKNGSLPDPRTQPPESSDK